MAKRGRGRGGGGRGGRSKASHALVENCGNLVGSSSSILGEEDDCVAENHQEEDGAVAMIEAEASPVISGIMASPPAIVLGQDQIDGSLPQIRPVLTSRPHSPLNSVQP